MARNIGVCAESECTTPAYFVFEVDARPKGRLVYIGACEEHKQNVLASARAYVKVLGGCINEPDGHSSGWREVSFN